MYFFIFLKNSDNIEGTLYKIAQDQFDLNNLNIVQSDYKIIQDSQENFNSVKLNIKQALKYNNNIITFGSMKNNFTKNTLQSTVDNLKMQIQQFLNNNPNHPLLGRWNNYYNQLNNFNLDSITYPFNNSLEAYFNDLGQPSYNILQLP
jgi:hypothetical protein